MDRAGLNEKAGNRSFNGEYRCPAATTGFSLFPLLKEVYLVPPPPPTITVSNEISESSKFRLISEVSTADNIGRFGRFFWNLAQFSGFQPIGARAVSLSRSI